MTELRWILIGFAIVLLAAIYLWGRRTSAAESQLPAGELGRPEPTLRDRDEGGQGDEPYDAELPTRDIEAAVEMEGSSARVALAPGKTSEAGVQPITAADQFASRERSRMDDTWRGRMEPTLSDPAITEELPVETTMPPTETSAQINALSAAAPTLSSGDTPSPRRIERRKILALRLAASPHRLDGARLLEAFEAEAMQHGRYEVFHRLHEDGSSIFSAASMVEPGTFDPENMPKNQYPGITLFAQLPGPVPGMHALNELVACARRLQQTLGGTLQDDRGVPLTVHRIERMRQEVREFERPAPAGARGHASPHS